MSKSLYQKIEFYHEQTKHHFNHFAKSSGYLDWVNQPDPFRTYKGTEKVELPLLKNEPKNKHMDLYINKNSSEKFTTENIAGFLELSLGLSAWKSVPGARWSLRINPSSGNLHPTEAHLVLPQRNGIKGGVYHYNPFGHLLELRGEIDNSIFLKIKKHFKSDGFLIAISNIFWREAWKYGERAFRYCNHDTGHALACLNISANLFGWKMKYLNCLSTEDIETILGFNKTEWIELEEEEAHLMCYVYPSEIKDIKRNLPQKIIDSFLKAKFIGNPNLLSEEKLNWKIIYETSKITTKEKTNEKIYHFNNKTISNSAPSPLTASEIIRKRRSAVDFNTDKSFLRSDQFFSLLDKTIPRNNCRPFDLELNEPSVHLLIFVHNIGDLEQGLYFFIRNNKDLPKIKKNTKSDFLWRKVKNNFPLYLLKKGNLRKEAQLLSCTQSIAGESAFSLGMIAKFKEVVEKEPYKYCHLFWETGMIGQVLYLEAEAQQLRGTGIGCFFDDPVHEIMGFNNNLFQSLYHFTIGVPLKDQRLKTLSPYFHLDRI